jgi:hypothetical protein
MRGKVCLALVTLLCLSLILNGISPAYGWNFSVDAEPEIRYAFPGQTVTYTVAVGLVLGPVETVQLMVSPMVVELLGFTFSFSPSSTGTPPFVRTLYVTVSPSKAPGTYTLPVTGFNVHVGWRPDSVTLVVLPTSPVTDWALSNPTMNPVSPKVGDPTTFSVLLSTLSTNRPYPQSVRIGAFFDGVFLGTVTVSYPGPTGFPSMLTTASLPWTAKEGYHTVVFTVDPSPYSYDDPNRYNNQVSLSFSVSAAPPPFDFSVSISPPTQKVTAGQRTSYTIVVSLVSGSGQVVSLSLSGLPSGATYLLIPPSSSPTFQSTLEVTTTESAPAGTYTLELTASGGGVTRDTSLSIEIEPAPVEDFSIAAAPTSSEVEQGDTATYIITITSMAGFKSAVDLSTSGLPTDVTAIFSLTKLTPGGSSTLTIRTTKRTPSGAYAITIIATGGSKTHDATVALTIKEGKPASFLEILGEYSLILMALLIVLVILMAVLLLWKRKPGPPPPVPAVPSPAVRTQDTFCASCGSRIPEDAQFCPKCGAKKVNV